MGLTGMNDGCRLAHGLRDVGYRCDVGFYVANRLENK
jgi:hypothetical protein